MLGERSTAKNCLFSLVSKVFGNNRLVDHQENCDLFSDFQYFQILGLNQRQIFGQLF